MENNYLILNPTAVPPGKEQEPAIWNLSDDAYQLLGDDKALVHPQTVQLQGIRHEQQVRLVGKPYSMYDDIDYLLAISG